MAEKVKDHKQWLGSNQGPNLMLNNCVFSLSPE